MKKQLILLPTLCLPFLASCGSNPQVTKQYTITFVDGNGDVLQQSLVDEGSLPIYEGKTPTKDPKAEYHENVYIGWDKEITAVTEDTTYSATFDYVLDFGSYPQSVVSDPEVIARIDLEYQDTFGYYYDDLGNKYYKLKSVADFKADDGSKVEAGKEYFFKVNPIRWKILGDEANLFYTTYNLIDVDIYNDWQPTAPAEHPNNYKYSHLHAWMNSTDEGGFMWRAFNATEQSYIALTTVKNDFASTKDELGAGEVPLYVCDDTQDYVFSLSRQELWDETLGFKTSDSIDDGRLAKTTDFARAKGATVVNNYGKYWTRSPSQRAFAVDDMYVYYVLCDGFVGFRHCMEEDYCVRPSIVLNLD